MNGAEFFDELNKVCRAGFVSGVAEGKMDPLQALGAIDMAADILRANIKAHMARQLQKPKLFVPKIIPGT